MELKRIVGPDAKTALRLVREQLGPDAMILSNRRVLGGVEIVAAPEMQSALAATRADGVPVLSPADRVEARAAVGAESPAAWQLQELQSELRSMRALLDQSMAEIRGARTAFGPGVEGSIWRRLTQLGIPNVMVRELVAQSGPGLDEETAWTLTLERIAAGLGGIGDSVVQEGVWACAGPTGAGKTTTVCKLAVRHALEHGTQGLVLLSMDGSRIGGADMLRTVARLLGVPFRAARAGESLDDLLHEFPAARLVLVDTAGLSRGSAPVAARISELGELSARVSTLLVLPATAQYACLEAAMRDYGACRPVAAVVTRLDEATSLGEIIGVLWRARLPLAYTSDGPEIPADLHVGTGNELVAHAVKLDPDTGSAPGERHAALAAGRFDPGAEGFDAARISR